MAFDSTRSSSGEYTTSRFIIDDIESAISDECVNTYASDDIESLRLQASRLEHLLQVMPAGVIVIIDTEKLQHVTDSRETRAFLGQV